MAERGIVMQGDRRRNAAAWSFALRGAGLIVTGGRLISTAEKSHAKKRRAKRSDALKRVEQA